MSTSATTVPDPTPDAGHNYIPAMLAWAARQSLTPGHMVHMETLHDDWCGIWHGHRCHCEPTFRLRDDAGPPTSEPTTYEPAPVNFGPGTRR